MFLLNVDSKHPPVWGFCGVILTPVLAFTSQPKMRERSPSVLKAQCKRGHRHCRQGKDEGWERRWRPRDQDGGSAGEVERKMQIDVGALPWFIEYWSSVQVLEDGSWTFLLSSPRPPCSPTPRLCLLPPPFVIHPLISVFFTQPWLSEEFEKAKIFVLRLLCLPPFTTHIPEYLSISVHLDHTTSAHVSHLSRGSCPTCWLRPGCLFAFFLCHVLP